MKRVGWTTTAICAVLAALVLAPAARADGTPPSGALAGPWRSPADGVMQLAVSGATTADGVSLADATLTLNGTPVPGASLPLCAGGQPCQNGTATLPLDTTQYPDGTYHLMVTVSDTAGGVGTAFDEPDFQIWNHRPTGSQTATLIIGSGVPAPPEQSGPGTGVLGSTAGSCVKPKLSMRLSQKPLRIRHGVPVLVRGKRYRFTGRLTCLRNGRRVSAPKRTRISLRVIIHGKSHFKGRATVGSRGKVVVRIASPSSRTLEFRFTTPDHKVARVRIKVKTVKVHHRAKHKKG